MTQNIKSITNPKLKLEVLTPQEVDKIHDATLHIIENVGVRFPSKRALEIWETNGATVDHESMTVKVKPHIIEEAMKSAPPAYELGARDPEQRTFCPKRLGRGKARSTSASHLKCLLGRHFRQLLRG